MLKIRGIGVFFIFLIWINVFSNNVVEYVKGEDIKKYKNIFLFEVPKEKEREIIENKNEKILEKSKDIENVKINREQIVIKGLIIDTSSNLFEKLGMDWGLFNGEINFSKIFKNGGEFLGINFNFLRENGDIKIEAMPTLVILEGEKGELRVTEEVIVGEKKITKNNNEHSEPLFSEAGIVFKIEGNVEKIDGKKKILLKIDTEISNFKLTSNYSEKAGAKQKNQTKTVILMDDGNSVFIGGLKQNVDKGTVRKIPLLGEIPILGKLFTYRKSNRENRDIYIEIEASLK